MKNIEEISGYKYDDASLNSSHSYLVPAVQKILSEYERENRGRRLFDLGCGNGSVTKIIAERGYAAIGVDPSEEGIRQARANYPELHVDYGSAYDELAEKYGCFDVLVSLEVVEHVYNPRKYAATAYSLLNEGGIAIISTPYHGYWKNLALAASGSLDKHFTALWDHGHIKFWSIPTLSTLLKEAGFKHIQFHRVGRIPVLAKSMIAVAYR